MNCLGERQSDSVFVFIFQFFKTQENTCMCMYVYEIKTRQEKVGEGYHHLSLQWQVSKFEDWSVKAEASRPYENSKVSTEPLRTPDCPLPARPLRVSSFSRVGREWHLDLFPWSAPWEIFLVSTSLIAPEGGLAPPGDRRLWKQRGPSGPQAFPSGSSVSRN